MPAMGGIPLIIVLGIGLIAGSYGTLVGGGSLITIPTLILLGLPPHTAIGTNRLGVMGNPTAGWYEFKKGIRAITKQDYIIGASLSFVISIYSGFYGAGAGTLLTYVLVLFFGQTFLEGAATRKIAQFISTAMAIVIFAIGGVIHYPLGIALFIGNLIGSYIGAHYSERIGNIWIKRLFFAVVSIMAIKLFF
jgi:uncharacterized membrane protein YfcA